MSNKLILVRHSVPELDPSIPPREWSLNQVGKDQARLMARQLAAYSIDKIMSSSEPKALGTAQIIADYLRLPVEIVPGLHEHERPVARRVSEDHYRKTIAKMFAEPEILSFGYEAASVAGKRFNRAVQPLLQRYPDQGLAIVSHGTVMAMFTAIHLNVDPHAIWQRIGLPGALIFTRPQIQLIGNLRPTQ